MRSGVAIDAQMLYYRTNSAAAIAIAIDDAVSSGADVINMSLGFPRSQYDPFAVNPPCSPVIILGGLPTVLRDAFAAGVLIIESAANDASLGGACNVGYPAWRPEVVSVGALETDSVSDVYTSTPIASFSSRGTVPYTMAGGGAGASSAVNITGPGFISHNFTTGPANYNTTTSFSGTSYAAPIVAGYGAMLRDAFYSTTGWSFAASQARYLHVNMLLAGDHWPGPTGPRRRSRKEPHRSPDWDGFVRIRRAPQQHRHPT